MSTSRHPTPPIYLLLFADRHVNQPAQIDSLPELNNSNRIKKNWTFSKPRDVTRKNKIGEQNSEWVGAWKRCTIAFCSGYKTTYDT